MWSWNQDCTVSFLKGGRSSNRERHTHSHNIRLDGKGDGISGDGKTVLIVPCTLENSHGGCMKMEASSDNTWLRNRDEHLPLELDMTGKTFIFYLVLILWYLETTSGFLLKTEKNNRTLILDFDIRMN